MSRLVALALLLATGASVRAAEPADVEAGCRAWMESVKAYDDACDAILDGEPEDAVSALQPLFESRVSGDSSGVASLERRYRGKAAAFARIEPPAELSDLHGRTIAYYRAVEKAADGILTRGETIRSPAVRDAYQALYDFYHDVLGLLAEHGCNPGDVEALRTKMLPRLREVLDSEGWDDVARAGAPAAPGAVVTP